MKKNFFYLATILTIFWICEAISIYPYSYFPKGYKKERIILDEIHLYKREGNKFIKTPYKLHYKDEVYAIDIFFTKGKKRCDFIKIRYKGHYFWICEQYTSARSDVKWDGKSNLPIGKEIVDKNHSLPINYKPNDLITIPKKYVLFRFRKHKIRKEAWTQFKRMMEDALINGVHLYVVSAFRSYRRQRDIYLRKIRKIKKQKAVARPGHSEHQLGTTIDFSNGNLKHLLKYSFYYTPEGRWLRENIKKYGMRISYTKENENKTGYIPEPWHIRYMGRQR